MADRASILDVNALWSPPAGMLPEVAAAWREFYRKALSGKAGYVATPREYRTLYVAQKGRCAICRIAKGIHPDDPKGRGSRRLAIDHNHQSGMVRGLLCSGSVSANTCNRLIERYTPQALARAADYKSNPPARVLAEMNRVLDEVEDAGHTYGQDDLDRLAQAFLWPGDRLAQFPYEPGEPS